MKVILFGSTGMIGKGVLLECLDYPAVKEVVSVARTKSGLAHPKLREIVHNNFTDFSNLKDEFKNADACFFCLGVSAVGKTEREYSLITYDYTIAAARVFREANPSVTFIYVSGQSTDSTEKGRMMWARVKGRVENELLSYGFRQAYMFRPGAIIPLRGIRSRTPGYQFIYDYFGWLLWIMKRVAPDSITDTSRIGTAMIHAHLKGYKKPILDPADINALSAI